MGHELGCLYLLPVSTFGLVKRCQELFQSQRAEIKMNTKEEKHLVLGIIIYASKRNSCIELGNRTRYIIDCLNIEIMKFLHGCHISTPYC
jgi:hypothetical protein